MSLDLQKIDWTKPIEPEPGDIGMSPKVLLGPVPVNGCCREYWLVDFLTQYGKHFVEWVDENGIPFKGDKRCIRNTPPPPVTRTRFVNVYTSRECLHQTAEEAIEHKCDDAIAVAVPVEITYQP